MSDGHRLAQSTLGLLSDAPMFEASALADDVQLAQLVCAVSCDAR